MPMNRDDRHIEVFADESDRPTHHFAVKPSAVKQTGSTSPSPALAEKASWKAPFLTLLAALFVVASVATAGYFYTLFNQIFLDLDKAGLHLDESSSALLEESQNNQSEIGSNATKIKRLEASLAKYNRKLSRENAKQKKEIAALKRKWSAASQENKALKSSLKALDQNLISLKDSQSALAHSIKQWQSYQKSINGFRIDTNRALIRLQKADRELINKIQALQASQRALKKRLPKSGLSSDQEAERKAKNMLSKGGA